jgi:hypothetical protein
MDDRGRPYGPCYRLKARIVGNGCVTLRPSDGMPYSGKETGTPFVINNVRKAC